MVVSAAAFDKDRAFGRTQKRHGGERLGAHSAQRAGNRGCRSRGLSSHASLETRRCAVAARTECALGLLEQLLVVEAGELADLDE